MLEQLVDSPVITVNRAVAEAEVSGPQTGLDLLKKVEGLDDWHFYWSARADFLRRLGRGQDARTAYQRALDCDMNETDRAFLTMRLGQLGSSPN